MTPPKSHTHCLAALAARIQSPMNVTDLVNKQKYKIRQTVEKYQRFISL